MNNLAFIAENERLLEKLNNPNVKSFNGWKAVGKYVKAGQKQKSFRVQSGFFQRMNPITGASEMDPCFKTCYGFTADQVK